MSFNTRALSFATAALLVSAPCAAQEVSAEPGALLRSTAAPQGELCEVGCTAETGAGQVGMRQTREDAGLNIEPLGRIENRIRNRVNSRLRTRIDQSYAGQSNATAEIERASDRATSAKPVSRPR